MRTIPLTAAQHAVWFTEQAGVADGAYRMALGIWFGAELDDQALGEACAAVVERHPSLGSAVTTGPDGPWLVAAAEKVSLTVTELTDDAVTEWTARPFDLEHGPLARFTLFAGADRSLLLVTAHHIVFDGVSKDIVVHDLAEAYNAVRAGEQVRPGGSTGVPAPAEVSGHRPAGDQPTTGSGRYPTGELLTRATGYWRDRWSPPGQPLLPGLRRSPTTAETAATVEATLPTGLTDRLGPTAARLGVTRFELLLTVVHLLLARYGNAGQPVTLALSTRSTIDDPRQIGLHVNEVPLTVDPADGTVRGYARALRQRLRELYAVRTVPLAHCVTGLRPSAALTPLSLSYRRQEREPVFAGVDSRVDWSMHPAATAAALDLFLVDTPTTLRIVARHSPAAIPAEAVRRITGHLVTVLRAVLDDPEQPAGTVPLLPTDERELLDRCNATDRAYPADATLPALLAAAVAARPQAPAVTDIGADHERTTLSYAELDDRVRRFAAVLRDHRVGPGDRVAVSLPRSWQALVTVLAVLRCGAAYVPVDPGYPASRRTLLLTDARPAMLVTTADLAADAPPGLPTLTDLAGATGPAEPEPSAVAPDAPAYVMYTSGSTGRPKGVQVSHRALANLLLAMRDLLGSGPDDRWLALTPLSFDISGLELFLPLVAGGQVVVASALTATDGGAVAAFVRRERLTHVQATPSGWRILLDAGFDAPVVALTGGEALPVALARELRPRVRRLFNVYGPTETTIWSTATELPVDVDEVTIGRPLANTRVWVLNPAGEPAPVGLSGELYLGGAGLADGYLDRPELTAARFVDDPDRGRLYRTGDLCRLRPDGQLDYLGRVDDQVKIRGHRIEPGEIEAYLRGHPEVAEAAVVARGDDDLHLVGYVVGRCGAPDPAELRRYLAAGLPAVMVPTGWVLLDQLPRTPNGKLDRAALPDAPPSRPAAVTAPETGTAGTDGPGDPIVAELTVIWQEVLKVPDIGPDEDLFELGGHSLSITRISSRIHQRLRVQVELDLFFDHPTIAEIADVVRGQIRGQEGSLPIGPGNGSGPS